MTSRREVVKGLGWGTLGATLASHGFDPRVMLRRVASEQGLREIRVIENVWIPMSNGVKIAARIWLPPVKQVGSAI